MQWWVWAIIAFGLVVVLLGAVLAVQARRRRGHVVVIRTAEIDDQRPSEERR